MGIRNLTEDISVYSNSVVAVSLNETLTLEHGLERNVRVSQHFIYVCVCLLDIDR